MIIQLKELQKPRFAKRVPHEQCGSPLCYRTEFQSVDISCQSSVKQSESTPNSTVWQSLAFAHVIRQVSKSCRNLVLQMEDPWAMWSPFASGPIFDVWISPANRVPNNGNQHQTVGFGSLWPLLTRSRKFPGVAETSFCKVGTTRAMWSPLCYWAEFRRVDISYQSSTKQWESTPIRISIPGEFQFPRELQSKVKNWPFVKQSLLLCKTSETDYLFN